MLKPYKNEEHNRVEFLGVTAGIVTILTGLVFLEPDSVQILNTLTLLFLILINSLFLSNWTYLLAKEHEEKYKAAQVIAQIIGCLLFIKVKPKPLESEKINDDEKEHDNSQEEKLESQDHKTPTKARKTIKRRFKKRARKLKKKSHKKITLFNNPQPSMNNTSNEMLHNDTIIHPFYFDPQNPSQTPESHLPSSPKIIIKDPRAFRPDKIFI